MSKRIGIIGVGIMGEPMAKNLIGSRRSQPSGGSGPIALVEDGDLLLIDIPNRQLSLVGQKGKLPGETIVVVNLSGRGDKDVSIVEEYRPVK